MKIRYSRVARIQGKMKKHAGTYFLAIYRAGRGAGFVLTGVLSLLMLSCTELDEDPVGVLNPDSFFQSEADAETAVLGSYAGLARNWGYGRRLVMTLQLLGDGCDIGDIGTEASRVQLNGYTLDANNNNLEMVWTALYQSISAANAAIEGIPPVEMDETKKSELIAEARMVRALCYYHLVRLFGDIPYIVSFVRDPAEVQDIPRTSAEEVYAGIIADVENGIENLPDQYPGDVRSRPTKGTARTLLASVYLTLGEWEAAAEHAEAVINAAATYGYELAPDYRDLWNADLGDQGEQVWAMDFRGGISGESGSNVDYMAPMTGVRDADMGGWSVVVPSPGMYDSFDDRDYRKEVSFLTETPVDGVMTPYSEWRWPRIHMAKWCLQPGANANADGANSDINYVVFRYAEVLLIAAEALNEAGGPTNKAFEYLNAVRARARQADGTPHAFPADLQPGLSQVQFREAVREERRVELAFEWKRWYDLKRWNMLEEAFTGPDSYEPHPNVGAHHRLMPIPQDELIRNPNLLPQNEGY